MAAFDHLERKIIFYLFKTNKCNAVYILNSCKMLKVSLDSLIDCDFVPINISLIYWKLFQFWVQSSSIFCDKILQRLNPSGGTMMVHVELHDAPAQENLDLTSLSIFQGMVYEKLMCDTVMSYLSTLGGAFSALGDSFENCAKRAGSISLTQLKIAFRLKEEPLVARCRLYIALSLIQQNQLKSAKSIVKLQYEIAKRCNDKRLENACFGVWAKLQYAWNGNTKRLLTT